MSDWAKRRSEKHQCTGKVAFESFEEATAARLRMAGDHGDPSMEYRLTMYRCRWCGAVHLGKRSQYYIRRIETALAKRAEKARRKALWRGQSGEVAERSKAAPR